MFFYLIATAKINKSPNKSKLCILEHPLNMVFELTCLLAMMPLLVCVFTSNLKSTSEVWVVGTKAECFEVLQSTNFKMSVPHPPPPQPLEIGSI